MGKWASFTRSRKIARSSKCVYKSKSRQLCKSRSRKPSSTFTIRPPWRCPQKNLGYTRLSMWVEQPPEPQLSATQISTTILWIQPRRINSPNKLKKPLLKDYEFVSRDWQGRQVRRQSNRSRQVWRLCLRFSWTNCNACRLRVERRRRECSILRREVATIWIAVSVARARSFTLMTLAKPGATPEW